MAGSGTFVFDGDCGFCRRWVAWLEARLTEPVTVVPFQAADLVALGLRLEDVQTASYLVDGSGRRYRGSRSFSRALATRGRGGWRLLGLAGELPLVRHGLGLAYRWVARNRYRLPAPR